MTNDYDDIVGRWEIDDDVLDKIALDYINPLYGEENYSERDFDIDVFKDAYRLGFNAKNC